MRYRPAARVPRPPPEPLQPLVGDYPDAAAPAAGPSRDPDDIDYEPPPAMDYIPDDRAHLVGVLQGNALRINARRRPPRQFSHSYCRCPHCGAGFAPGREYRAETGGYVCQCGRYFLPMYRCELIGGLCYAPHRGRRPYPCGCPHTASKDT